MKTKTPTTPSKNGVTPPSKTKRICKYTKCNKNIDHLSKKFKYCSLAHRQKHLDAISNGKKKKPRRCIVCKRGYDFKARGLKWTCSKACEKKHENMEKVSGWQKYYTPRGDRVCNRCGVGINKKSPHCFCADCMFINKAMMKFKEGMR